jgi:predicted DNA-binding antitoxin AbrB/MazE fold protein
MGIKIRAVYEEGHLRLLDPVELREGQQVDVIIESTESETALRTALGDLVRWPDPADERDAEIEAQAEAIDRAFSGGRPVSEILIEDRGDV